MQAVHLVCTPRLYTSSVHLVCTPRLYTSSVHLVCTPRLYTSSVHLVCTPRLYTSSVHLVCTPRLYTSSVHLVCTPRLYTSSVHLVCARARDSPDAVQQPSGHPSPPMTAQHPDTTDDALHRLRLAAAAPRSAGRPRTLKDPVPLSTRAL